MGEETKAPSAESIIGTVVGSMMSLRKGKQQYAKEIASSVTQQLDLLRVLLESKDKLIKSQAARIEELMARHNPEICVDVQEGYDRLQAENAALREQMRKHDMTTCPFVFKP